MWSALASIGVLNLPSRPLISRDGWKTFETARRTGPAMANQFQTMEEFSIAHTHILSLSCSHMFQLLPLILLLPRSLISRDPLSRKRVRDKDATIIDGVTGWALRLDGALGSLPLGTCSPTPSFITGVFFFRAFSSAVVLHFVIVSYLKSFSTLAFCIKEA